MVALTWREVGAPNFGASLSSIGDASQAIGGSFNNLAANLANIGQRQRREDTGAAQLALSQFGSNTDLQSAIRDGLVGNLQNQYGNLDSAALADYLNNYATSLQNREKTQQGIDLTNNQNQYGGAIADALVRAGQGDMSGWAAIQSNPEIMGGLISDAAPNVQTAQGQFATRAETARSNRANEGNAAARLALAQREFNAGQLQRDIQTRLGQRQLSNMDATDAGGNALKNIGSLPVSQFRQAEVERLQKEGRGADYINNYVKGLDSQYQLATGNNPNAPVAQAAVAAGVTPQAQGNTQAATDSINANYDAQNTLMRTWRNAQQDATDYKGDSNKAIDAIIGFAPDADRSDIRNYVAKAVDAGVPLNQVVAAARNNTTSTKWGAVKSVLPGFQDDSSKLDTTGALRTAKALQDSNSRQELAELSTRMAVDQQAVSQAEQVVNSAVSLFQEMSTRFGGSSPQARAAWDTLQQTLQSQRNLANGFRNSSQQTLRGTNTETLTKEDLQRQARYAELMRRTGANNPIRQ